MTPDPDYWGWYVSPTSPVDTWNQVKHLSPNDLNDFFHDPLVAVRSDSLARTQFLGKLADAAGKDQWELGVFAGEFREACGMAADLASGMVGGIARLSTIHRKPPRAISDTLSVYGEEGPKAALRALGSNDSSLLQSIVSGWLVVQFGLKPLFLGSSNGNIPPECEHKQLDFIGDVHSHGSWRWKGGRPIHSSGFFSRRRG